ncbi:phosphonate ABC transporter, permease protein PhnE [Nesterenkonia sp.]|uniref:phosphonate ABC transporter, permease protein PhnE n=1 Tax=Nesterenkonia sp. TaxID=704201 RepID=UPI002625905F|nr:phosphonate ABC transporter, permease protein PhnE [Nesterenkonia sp.]
MTAAVSPADAGPAAEVKPASRPTPPRPSLAIYLGLAALAVAAFIWFWQTRESTAVLYVPLGEIMLWAPQNPLIGFLVMLAVLAVCWRTRTGAMAAFGALSFVIFTYWAGARINFSLTSIPERWSNLEGQLQAFFRPNWSYVFGVWDQWLTTLNMAIVATALGCFIGLLLAMIASPVSSPNKPTSQSVKALNSVVRSIPDVGWALLFVALIGGTAYGLGPLAGVLALLMFNIGIVAKLLGETIDAVSPGPIEAADAAGANLLQRDRIAVLPQVMPGFVSYSLYVFELNIRASTAIGIVGVGGIGQELSLQMNRFAWENVAAILYALIVVVLLVDLFSMWIRRRLM